MERTSSHSRRIASVQQATESRGAVRVRKQLPPRPAVYEGAAPSGVVASPGLHPRGLAVVESTWMQHAGLRDGGESES